ncbi:hypothetical protein M422DRAFT_193889, partial [Sphaerobolus stellatus SS14]
VHYGIDTNNYIESWHSNLKANYLGRGRKHRLDYMIRILTQDVEPDFMYAHVRCGLGFQGRHLCKAERIAKERASTLMYEEAQIHVEQLERQKVYFFIFLCIHPSDALHFS